MKASWYNDGERIAIVFYEMTPEEREMVISKIPQDGKAPDAWLKPVEVYREKFLNGPFAGKTVKEALTDGGDAAFCWISGMAKAALIQTDASIGGQLNTYLMTRFRDVKYPAAYVLDKDEDACDAFIRAFKHCAPKKLLSENGVSSADEMLKKRTEEKKAYIEGFVRYCQRLAQKYAH